MATVKAMFLWMCRAPNIWFLYGTVPPFQGPEIPIDLISFCLAATFQPAQALLNGVRDRAGEAAAQLGLKNPARLWGNFGCFFDQPEMVVTIKFGVWAQPTPGCFYQKSGINNFAGDEPFLVMAWTSQLFVTI